MPLTQKYYKVSFFIKKKPGITDEEFHAHWEGVHKDLPQTFPEFMKIVKRYQQWHVTKESREQGASLGFPMMEYDGAAELHFATLEDYKACLKLPRWEAIFKDEEKFIDLPIHTMYGYEYLVIGEPLVYNEPDHQILP